jgi:hypothetical protein
MRWVSNTYLKDHTKNPIGNPPHVYELVGLAQPTS